METFDSIIKFLSSYPIWAKAGIIGGLLFSSTILVFAPREISANGLKGNENFTRVFMRIEEIRLFPVNENTEIQLYAIVNGNRYRHPSVGGIEWMKVGPGMSHKVIELPKTDRYEIRFELIYRNGKEIIGSTTILENVKEKAMMSQMIRRVMKIPFSEEYELYPVKNKTRSASVGASVSYSIYGTK